MQVLGEETVEGEKVVVEMEEGMEAVVKEGVKEEVEKEEVKGEVMEVVEKVEVMEVVEKVMNPEESQTGATDRVGRCTRDLPRA